MSYHNLTDGTIYLRALEPGDATTLYIWENDTADWRYGDRRAPLSLAQLNDYVANYDANPFSAGQLRLMIALCDTNEVVGAVDLTEIDAVARKAAVGILVSRNQRGRGYAHRTLQLLSSYARDMLSLHQLWAIVGSTNEPSRRLFEGAGYEISGRLRSWVRIDGRYDDAYLYQKLFQ